MRDGAAREESGEASTLQRIGKILRDGVHGRALNRIYLRSSRMISERQTLCGVAQQEIFFE
jgi:hypothetical protein